MFISRSKNFLKQSAEGIFAVLLVLVFFSIFLFMLYILFPSGAGLKTIIAYQGPPTSTGLQEQGSRELLLAHGEYDSDLTSQKDAAAVLSLTRNTVKSKSSEAIAWKTAKEGKNLYDRDAVQTLDRSSAVVKFDENSAIDMGANSLLIIKRLDQDPLFREKRSFMVLVDGDLRGKLAKSDKNSIYLEVDTPGAKMRMQSGPMAEGPVDFKISVNPDKSSTIAVYQGVAEIMAQGKTVFVEANQSTVVALDQAPLAPVNLLGPVKLKSPSDTDLYYYRNLPPKVQFAWQSQPVANSYHFVMARDNSFKDIIADEQFSLANFTHGNLIKGTYFWKVSGFDKTIEGFFSETRRFQIIQDKKPPTLNVKFPPKTVYRGRYTLRGETEPGSRVFVGGKPVKTTKTGKFKFNLKLQPGINVIVVEAIDSVNNVVYRSQRVNRKT
jgi:hypothetical protein